MTRRFTLECLSRFGTEVEDVKLILGNQHLYYRKLSDTKRRQFANLYQRALEDLISGDYELHGILITRIEVPMVLKHIQIHWRCTGDVQRDEEIDQILEKHADSLRSKLSEMFFHTPIPPFVFVEDRRHLYEQELSKLLEIADYGMQYRAVSHVGAILGSSRDTGTKSADPNDPTVPKEQVPPRWLENWRNRRAKAAQKKESIEKRKESEVILDGNRDN
ncbi:hypothetical protein niasHT_010798 [Heterodera trifolii]|uniref:Uncharacterized protein n=1 Tax=Heterodera trifolii TaxID=157864 RepID=A0ABD2KVD8_9BILA